jgi:selenocysteine-specific elongation factor
MIVGTAGHIDHGKTTLVRALTGVDTDRLKEEKERGISIELGYAYTALTDGAVLGFIDVPGHERLVHTMVAGACGIDFALLVVAADDGAMPQTREHLAILGLLGVSQGAVALTKVDRVDPPRALQASAEVQAALASTALRGAPVFPLDATATDHPGMVALRRHLHEAAAQCAARPDQGLFRLAVDRVFTLAGHGTIVAGTVFSGQVHVGDTVAVMPRGLAARVRSIHAQNRPAESGHAGERCALNVAGVEKSAVSRGDWLADPRALAPTTRIDVRMTLLADGGARLQAWSPLHVHLGTTRRVAHVVPLAASALAAGESGRAQLVFDTPLCALPGDRLIVRDAQGRRTLGGGTVLDPFAPARQRRGAARMEYLDALERLVAGEGVAPLLRQAPCGLRVSELVHLTGCPPERLSLPSGVRTIAAGGGQFVLPADRWRSLREAALAALRRFHADVPDEPGPDVGRLRRMALPGMPAVLWRALIEELAGERLLQVSGAWLHLPEHTVTLTESDQLLARKLQPLIAAGGFDPPWVRELAAEVREPEERVREVLRKQLAQGTVYQVVHDLFYDRERIAQLAELIGTDTREHGGVNAARFRDAVGLGRKRTIQILEFFDRVGYTRRVRDAHVPRADRMWKAHVPGGAAGLQTQEGASDASW